MKSQQQKIVFSEAIRNLLAAGDDIVRSDDETHYIHKPTGQRLLRCTNFIEGCKPFGMTENSPWYGCLAMGSAADQLVRDYFVEGIDYVRDQAKNTDAYAALTQQALIQLTSAVRAYDAAVIRPYGWKVLADRVYLYSLELGVAGEVDLILYREDTREVKIIDMKTVRSPKYIDRKVDKYSRQLNTYRVMAEEIMGNWDVTDLEIMWIKTSYDEWDTQTSTAYLHDMMTVEMKDEMPAIRTIWQKEKGMDPADYTFGQPKQKRPVGESKLFDAYL